MVKPKATTIKLEEISPFNINVRFNENLKIPMMKQQMEQRMKAGEHPVEDPIHVVRIKGPLPFKDDYGFEFGTRTWTEFDNLDHSVKEQYIVLRGYRRVGGVKAILADAQRLIKDETFKAEDFQSIKQVPAIVYDLPHETKEDWDKIKDMVRDHARSEGLAPSEVARTIFQKLDYGQKIQDVMVECFSMIRNARLLNRKISQETFDSILDEVDMDVRAKRIRSQLGNQITYFNGVSGAGPAIVEQCLLWMKKADNILSEEEEEKLVMDCKYTNIRDYIVPGVKEDRKTNQRAHVVGVGWEDGKPVVQGGGPALRDGVKACILALKDPQKAESKPRPMSAKNLEDLRASCKNRSDYLTSLTDIVSGHENKKHSQSEIVAWAEDVEKTYALLREYQDGLPGDIKVLVAKILGRNLDNLRKFLQTIAKKEVEAKDMLPTKVQ